MAAIMLPMSLLIYSWGENATERLTGQPDGNALSVWEHSEDCLERASAGRWFLESAARLTLDASDGDLNTAYDLVVEPNIDESVSGMDINRDGDTADTIATLRISDIERNLDESALGVDLNGDGDTADTIAWHLPSMPYLPDFPSFRNASDNGSLGIWKAINHGCWEAGIP